MTIEYREFELLSAFYEKILIKVQGELKNGLNYFNFELSGLYLKTTIKQFNDEYVLYIVHSLSGKNYHN